MRARTIRQIFLALLLARLIWPGQAATQQTVIPEKYKGIILYAPEPEYPLGIEQQTILAQGVYRLTINQKTGEVDEVGVLLRCGDRRLDGACVMAFFQWKFRPGAIKQIDIPVTFERFVRVTLKRAASR